MQINFKLFKKIKFYLNLKKNGIQILIINFLWNTFSFYFNIFSENSEIICMVRDNRYARYFASKYY